MAQPVNRSLNPDFDYVEEFDQIYQFFRTNVLRIASNATAAEKKAANATAFGWTKYLRDDHVVDLATMKYWADNFDMDSAVGWYSRMLIDCQTSWGFDVPPPAGYTRPSAEQVKTIVEELKNLPGTEQMYRVEVPFSHVLIK
jgi:hypothetical protein